MIQLKPIRKSGYYYYESVNQKVLYYNRGNDLWYSVIFIVDIIVPFKVVNSNPLFKKTLITEDRYIKNIKIPRKYSHRSILVLKKMTKELDEYIDSNDIIFGVNIRGQVFPVKIRDNKWLIVVDNLQKYILIR